MKIEEEIRQGKFQSEYHKLAINLTFTANWLTRQVTQGLKPHKLTPQQYNVLRILRGQHPNPASINLITERMIDKMSNASRLVDKLLAKELVERTTCPLDRRQVDVKMTKKGLDLLEKIDIESKNWDDNLKALSKKEAQELNSLLDMLRS